MTTAGVFLRKGSVFRKRGGDVFLSLGFRTWGALGLPLRQVNQDGEAWLFTATDCFKVPVITTIAEQ